MFTHREYKLFEKNLPKFKFNQQNWLKQLNGLELKRFMAFWMLNHRSSVKVSIRLRGSQLLRKTGSIIEFISGCTEQIRFIQKYDKLINNYYLHEYICEQINLKIYFYCSIPAIAKNQHFFVVVFLNDGHKGSTAILTFLIYYIWKLAFI